VPPRRFFRPKGSASLGWRPARGWDTSLKLSRRVGQISFYDFLAQPNLQQDRQTAGNPDLVPPQSWEFEGQAGRELGAWGKTRLKLFYNRISDLIDIVPVGLDGEGVGNLPAATSVAAESTSTIQFDPLGWTGAKLDMTLGIVRTRVRDPLTGIVRSFNGKQFRYAELAFRRDVPRTPFAWGGDVSYGERTLVNRLTEVYYSNEGPFFVSGFVEHKNVRGLTVRAEVVNLLNARHRFDRAVYAGYRTTAPLLFRQLNDQLIGPIFTLKVTGSF
jgi:outer membrane receptor for ferrienterochelin and colicins